MTTRSRGRGFTLLELAISLVLVSILVVILVPALAQARVLSRRELCASNQRRMVQAWHTYLEDNEGRFPYVPIQGGWRYGGMRFSSVDGRPFLDTQRPLTPYLPGPRTGQPVEGLLLCPADHGITGETTGVGTGRRTAYRSFGTSYRANACLLDARQAGLHGEHRALSRGEITTVATRLVLMGDPVWYEVFEQTDRHATWHGEEGTGNILFLDGSVKYMKLRPRTQVGPAVVVPRMLRQADERSDVRDRR